MGGCKEGAIGVDIGDLVLTLRLQCEGGLGGRSFRFRWVNLGLRNRVLLLIVSKTKYLLCLAGSSRLNTLTEGS